ncbi:unnamed protein product [Candida verbasci]|uniref:Ribonuclease n=1 Tax=Candida verbasci TaxID=1227364 RepID=A0A9W4U0H3_9ASCO|nr:unnamed protein product [Candida verbasci]
MSLEIQEQTECLSDITNNTSITEHQIKRKIVLETSEEIEPITKKSKSKSNKTTSKWYPPSVTSIEKPFDFKTTTYFSKVPIEIEKLTSEENENSFIVIGVDEAGRGPVLGPMVYGISYSLERFSNDLQNKYGFADSKVLTDDKRQELFKLIEDETHELNKNVGWATTTITAKDISSGMLKSKNAGGSGLSYNLNEQAHDVTIDLIKNVVKLLNNHISMNKIKLFIDTVGPPITYQNKLKNIFPQINEIIVTKKADSIYSIVSTASVVAKVTRDLNINYFTNTEFTNEVKRNILYNEKLGSGYPSDPNTNKWLNNIDNIDKLFGWCFGFIRYSWQTTKDCLIKNKCINIIYEEDCEEYIKKKNGYKKDVYKLMEEENNNNNVKPKFDKSYYVNTFNNGNIL